MNLTCHWYINELTVNRCLSRANGRLSTTSFHGTKHGFPRTIFQKVYCLRHCWMAFCCTLAYYGRLSQYRIITITTKIYFIFCGCAWGRMCVCVCVCTEPDFRRFEKWSISDKHLSGFYFVTLTAELDRFVRSCPFDGDTHLTPDH